MPAPDSPVAEPGADPPVVEPGTGREPTARRWLPAWLPALIPVALALISHASYLGGGFTWLDHGDVEEGLAVLAPEQLGRAFTEPFGATGFYRPLVTLAHSLDAWLHGTDSAGAAGFHATNVLLHAAVTAAVYALLLTFFSLRPAEAALGASVAAVHPLSWLPAGQISYRPELLVTLCVLAAVSLYVRARRRDRLPLAAAAAFFAALLAKESALAWVPALVAVDEAVGWWRRRSGGDRSGGAQSGGDRVGGVQFGGEGTRHHRWAALACMALPLLPYALLRWLAVPGGWGLSAAELPPSQALGTRLAVVGQRLVELVRPALPPLSDAAAIVPLTAPAALAALAAIGVVAVALAIALRSVRRGPETPEARDAWLLVRALLFLAVALAPALNLLPLPRFSSPHYGYFALPAVAALAALAWRRGRRARPPVGVAVSVLLGVWLLTLAAVTWSGGPRHRDDGTLFAPAVAEDPAFREGWHYLGGHLLAAGDLRGAAAALDRAVAPTPGRLSYVDRPAALIDLAVTRFQQRRPAAAEAHLAAAEAEAPAAMRPLIRYNRAVIAAATGRPERVVELLARPGDGENPDPDRLLERARVELPGGAVETGRPR